MKEVEINKCENCGNEVPKKGMKFCCRKCTDEAKSKRNNEIRSCLMCNKEFKVQKSNKKTICSDKCRKKWLSIPENKEKRLKTSIDSLKEKYGVDNIFKLEEFQKKGRNTKKEKYGDENYNNMNKHKKTSLERFGVEHASQNEEIKQKTKETIKKRLGVDHPLQLEEYRDKQKQTNLEKYGFEYVGQIEEFREKAKKTNLERYGCEYATQNKEIKKKSKETSLKKYGVDHHLKDPDLFCKHFISMCKMKKYKETELYYQGSYELYFLEEIERVGLISEINNGKSYKYIFEEKEHNYHTDFSFKGINVEIKSGWTYNKNGKDKRLEDLNETKYNSVRESGDKIMVLINKNEIDNFIKTISF